ncbi:virulence associated lipoprotein (plasmid) [Borreliella turdi]|uniref:virulence associated lipoprotein n=1 Tax=Borreliella turdi TaxID=57863 RepID=UPI003AF1A741
MKYNIIASIFVFLFLNACNPDFNTNQKDIKHKSKELKSNKKKLKPKTAAILNQEKKPNQEEGPNERTKNTLLYDLINLIETANLDREKYVKKMEEEPSDQYGMLVFKQLGWGSSPGEMVSDNSERSIRYRRRVYDILSTIDTNKLKAFSKMIILSGQIQGLLNILNLFGGTLDDVIIRLSSKKDTLYTLATSSLEKLKNSFEKLLSIKKIVSKMLHQLLLDYQNNKSLIKTNRINLESHANTLVNQIVEKNKEAEKLKNNIFSIH